MTRGNGTWPGWHQSPPIDPAIHHEGRISYLEAKLEGITQDVTDLREDTDDHRSMLLELRDMVLAHVNRSLLQHIRHHWDEAALILVIAMGVSYLLARPDMEAFSKAVWAIINSGPE